MGERQRTCGSVPDRSAYLSAYLRSMTDRAVGDCFPNVSESPVWDGSTNVREWRSERDGLTQPLMLWGSSTPRFPRYSIRCLAALRKKQYVAIHTRVLFARGCEGSEAENQGITS